MINCRKYNRTLCNDLTIATQTTNYDEAKYQTQITACQIEANMLQSIIYLLANLHFDLVQQLSQFELPR